MSKFSTLVCLIFALSTAACNNTEFKSGTEKKPATNKAKKETPEREVTKIDDQTAVETFSIDAKEKSKIDMVWAVDNSGSMNQEAAQVKKNLELFVNNLSKQNNVRMALISSTEATSRSTGVTLSETAKQAGHIQVPGTRRWGVGSTDALAIIASAVGASVSPDLSPFEFSVSNDSSFGGYKDSLKGFFRENAKTVFVIVSDDDAYGVNASNFLDLIKDQITDSQPLVYGFVGTQQSRCDIATTGNSYQTLAEKTKGQVYDICEADWQQHFEKLTDHVETSVSSQFALKSQNIQSIKSVELDGVALTKDQYKFEGQSLVIAEGVLTPQHKSLKVTLAVKP